MKRAVVLFSGGLDSSTVLAIARQDGFEMYAMTFDYGQRHKEELKAAERGARHHGVAGHLVVEINLCLYGESALTSATEVPKTGVTNGIPVTYVPARNTIFLSYALAWAELLGASCIYIGVNAVDYSGYPDCRPKFIQAFQQVESAATGDGVDIEAPLLHLSKSQIIKRGAALGVNYAITHTCYDPHGGLACGKCDACRLRLKGFADANMVDPVRYV